jgi:hypothetical protein
MLTKIKETLKKAANSEFGKLLRNPKKLANTILNGFGISEDDFEKFQDYFKFPKVQFNYSQYY